MGSTEIQIHPLTADPTAAWASIADSQVVRRLKPMPLDTPISPNKVRFVCISDTHSMISRMKQRIPDGDILLHAGDFTRCGMESEVREFNDYLATLPHKHKIVIAGNHELSFDPRMNSSSMGSFPFLGHAENEVACGLSTAKQNLNTLTNATYLEDNSIVLYGIKIYGTPWQPEFCNWAFNLPRGAKCLEKWNMISDDTDILLSHSPPLGREDLTVTGVRAGCAELLSTVQQRVKPKFHVFGHIHEDYGLNTDGQTVFINCSTCNVHYKPENPPVIFDFPLPTGQMK